MTAWWLFAGSIMATIIYIICMECWPGKTTGIVCAGLIALMIWGWWTDPATFDKPPPYEHCSGGKCWYDREMMERMRSAD